MYTSFTTLPSQASRVQVQERPPVDDYADTVIPAEVAHEIMNSVMARVTARMYEAEDTNPAEVERLRSVLMRLRQEKVKIRCATPDHSNALSLKWGQLLKNNAALWSELNG